MFKEREIDFEVLREPWNKYELEDGSYIKSKYVLTKIRISEPDESGRVKISIDGRTITVTYNVPDSLKGEPSVKRYAPEELQSAIEKEVGYKIVSEEWNEYIAENGMKIRIKDNVTRIHRTKLKDRNGDPIYFVEHSTLVQGTSPRR